MQLSGVSSRAFAVAVIFAAAVGAGIVVPGWLSAQNGPVASPAPSRNMSGLQRCAEVNTTPCTVGGTSEDQGYVWVLAATPAGNVSLHRQQTRRHFGQPDKWDVRWMNVSVEGDPGNVTVEVTHPDGNKTWIPPGPDGWANRSFHDPVFGNWTFDYHPHVTGWRVQLRHVTTTHAIVYEFGD